MLSGDLSGTLIRVIIMLPALLLGIILHEVGHAYVAYLCGDDTAKHAGRITLSPLPHVDRVGSVMMLPICHRGSRHRVGETGAGQSAALPTRQVGAWQLTLFRFNRDQAVGSLPLLIRILPVRNTQKLMIIERSLFVVAQVVIGGGPKKKTNRGHLRLQ